MLQLIKIMSEKSRRTFVVVLVGLLVFLAGFFSDEKPETSVDTVKITDNLTSKEVQDSPLAGDVLETLEVKGRAPKSDYRRSQFGDGWAELSGCDTRNYILNRDLTDVVNFSDTDCRVVSGVLLDPYTNKLINFQRGADTSDAIQIDHVVALSDAWQKGAQNLSFEDRVLFANDGLNLLAVDGPANQQKSGSDSASWLPPNKGYRCMYVARQVAVKSKYKLWVTSAEKEAMKRVLGGCVDQRVPVIQ